MSRFQAHTAETCPEASRAIVTASQRQFGFLPAPVAHVAESPALLAHMLAGFAAFDRSSLDATAREVVALTVAFEIGCHYCMAMHSALLTRTQPQLVAALRAADALPDPRLQALACFVRALLAYKGQVPEATWRAFTDAGWSARQALDTVLGTGVYLLSTLSNVLTEAPLDAAFQAFAWTKPPT